MITGCSKYLLSICLFLTTLPLAVYGAPKESYIDGKDYIKLPVKIRNNADVAQLLINNANKIQVLYFFSYGCPACARFDPDFEKWEKKQSNNKKLVIYRIPVSFKDEWEKLAKLYYVMKMLDPKSTLDEKIFEAIHQKRLQLWQEPIMKEFFLKNGYSAKDFENVFNSFSVNMEVKKAEKISNAYAIEQTPTMVINGFSDIYRLNLSRTRNDVGAFFEIVDYLIVNESKNFQKKKK